MSSLLRGTRKLLLAAGLAGCGAAATVLLSGYNRQSEGFKARASDAMDDTFDHHLFGDSVFPSYKWDYNWDRREPYSLVKPLKRKPSEKDENNYNKKLEAVKSKANRHLILVRDGHYNINGENDSLQSLTILGTDQAKEVALRLKDLALPYTRIVHSSMTRTKQTAHIISNHLPNVPVESCDFMRKGCPVVAEPAIFLKKPEHKLHEDGARLEAAFRKYFHRAEASQTKDSYEVLVCSANVIRYFVCRALQFPPEGWLRFSIHNCSLTWIKISPSGRVVVYSVGDIGHMPSNKMTL